MLGLDIIGQQQGGAWSYFGYDGLGSVRQVYDNLGAAGYTASYAPYGTPFEQYGDLNSLLGFTGEQTDPTGMLFLRARYYNPNTGTFLSHDPFEGLMDRVMSRNGYSYVEGNPINFGDPSGRMAELVSLLPWAKIVAAVVTAAPVIAAVVLAAVVVVGVVVVAALLLNQIVGCVVGEQGVKQRGKIVTDAEAVLREAFKNHPLLFENRSENQENWRPYVWPQVTPAPTQQPSPTPSPTPDKILLYHYTKAENVASILNNGLNPSDPKNGDAHFGPGQYFTDLTPSEMSNFRRGQAAKSLFKSPYYWMTENPWPSIAWIEYAFSKNDSNLRRVAPLFPGEVQTAYPNRGFYVYWNESTEPLVGFATGRTGFVTFQQSPSGQR